MRKCLKTQVIEQLKEEGFVFESLPVGATSHRRGDHNSHRFGVHNSYRRGVHNSHRLGVHNSYRRGVHYFRTREGIDCLRGAMDMAKDGRKCKKRIVVRPSRFRSGWHELYTYHFPKVWSAACVANRELIKEAQRLAHALEKDFGPEGLEWRIRFFNHYFRVFKGGAKPEEGMKAYSRFYQYTYVAIYRQLKAEEKPHPDSLLSRGGKEAESVCLKDEISFEPIDFRPRLRAFASPLRRSYNYFRNSDLKPPDIQAVINLQNIPRTTEEFVYVKKKQ